MTIGWRGKSSLAWFASALMARRTVIIPSDEISAGTVPGPPLDLGADGTIAGRIATFMVIDDPIREADNYWPSEDPKRFRALDDLNDMLRATYIDAPKARLQRNKIDEPRPERGKVRKGKKQRLKGLRP